ncbi:MAG: histone deacetylase [Candidatus Aenigmarchaeota archaeon]|nr:histone deacetylase [Candidatus Aenigmarchaeota archaeon]
MQVFFSHKCLEYKQDGHPESPARVKSIYKHIKDKFDFSEPEPCTDKDLVLCHEKGLINRIRHRDFSGADTPNLPQMFGFAKLSAGSAIEAAQHAVNGENAFSLSRPPGHHAGKDFLGGFCYFNSIAVAVKKILEKVDKVAIIDIDGHHGNGTQDIMIGNKDVVFVSLHQKNAFPVSGFVSERNCFNYPLVPGTNGREYVKVFDSALENVEKFSPDIIAVSAGFDAYKKDPLLELALDIATYFEIADMISHLGVPVFSVLEGGYSEEIGKCVHEFLKGLG